MSRIINIRALIVRVIFLLSLLIISCEESKDIDDVDTFLEATDPKGTDPEVTDLEVTDPEVADPEVTDIEVTDPEVADPEVADPEVTDLEVTDDDVSEDGLNVGIDGWESDDIDYGGKVK